MEGRQAMKGTGAGGWKFAPKGLGLATAWHCAAVFLGALLLSWPALYNGFPLLYPDSMTYLDDGRIVARAVFLRDFSEYYGMRSLFYSLGILPWHWNINPWPVIYLQCLLVAWAVWLVVRSIAPRQTAPRYLALMVPVSLLTSASWYSAFLMPDILGPVAYLAIYLLAFAREGLSRTERVGLYLAAGWGIAAHASHFLLAAGLCVLLVVYAAFERRPFLGRLRVLGEVAAILAVVAGAQMALHGYLYGKPSLNGERPPYLLARVIADGPGRWYLEGHCEKAQWAVCGHLQELSGDSDEFLWGEEGGYEAFSDGERARLKQEEMPLVLATARAYPREQLERSAANFLEQLLAFGLYGFDSNPWTLGQFDYVLPKARASYLASRQARDELPLDTVTSIQWWTVLVSLAAMGTAIPLLWRHHSARLAGLSLVIFSMVILNAGVTGVLSVVDDRYGCRMMWLIPLLAGVMGLDWLEERKTAREGVR
jgi:hypothetical protein